MAKVGLEMKLLTAEVEAEAEKWDEYAENDIVKRAKVIFCDSTSASSSYERIYGSKISKNASLKRFWHAQKWFSGLNNTIFKVFSLKNGSGNL